MEYLPISKCAAKGLHHMEGKFGLDKAAIPPPSNQSDWRLRHIPTNGKKWQLQSRNGLSFSRDSLFHLANRPAPSSNKERNFLPWNRWENPWKSCGGNGKFLVTSQKLMHLHSHRNVEAHWWWPAQSSSNSEDMWIHFQTKRNLSFAQDPKEGIKSKLKWGNVWKWDEMWWNLVKCI